MNCKEIQELLITSYIDSEIDDRSRSEIGQHLKTCKECDQFEQILKQAAVTPFEGVTKEKVPEYIWHRLKGRIEREQAVSQPVNLFDRLRTILPIRRPAFALAAATVAALLILVITKMPFNGQKTVNAYLDEQLEFFSYTMNGEENGYSSVDFGTDIEKYFL